MAFEKACACGNLSLVQFMIEKSVQNFNVGMYYATVLVYLSIEQMYALLERGIGIESFEPHDKFKDKLQEIKRFRHQICAVNVCLLIPDLLNLVSQYSLK